MTRLVRDPIRKKRVFHRLNALLIRAKVTTFARQKKNSAQFTPDFVTQLDWPHQLPQRAKNILHNIAAQKSATFVRRSFFDNWKAIRVAEGSEFWLSTFASPRRDRSNTANLRLDALPSTRCVAAFVRLPQLSPSHS